MVDIGINWYGMGPSVPLQVLLEDVDMECMSKFPEELDLIEWDDALTSSKDLGSVLPVLSPEAIEPIPLEMSTLSPSPTSSSKADQSSPMKQSPDRKRKRSSSPTSSSKSPSKKRKRPQQLELERLRVTSKELEEVLIEVKREKGISMDEEESAMRVSWKAIAESRRSELLKAEEEQMWLQSMVAEHRAFIEAVSAPGKAFSKGFTL